VPTGLGLGIQIDTARLDKYTVAKETFTASA